MSSTSTHKVAISPLGVPSQLQRTPSLNDEAASPSNEQEVSFSENLQLILHNGDDAEAVKWVTPRPGVDTLRVTGSFSLPPIPSPGAGGIEVRQWNASLGPTLQKRTGVAATDAIDKYTISGADGVNQLSFTTVAKMTPNVAYSLRVVDDHGEDLLVSLSRSTSVFNHSQMKAENIEVLLDFDPSAEPASPDGSKPRFRLETGAPVLKEPLPVVPGGEPRMLFDLGVLDTLRPGAANGLGYTSLSDSPIPATAQLTFVVPLSYADIERAKLRERGALRLMHREGALSLEFAAPCDVCPGPIAVIPPSSATLPAHDKAERRQGVVQKKDSPTARAARSLRRYDPKPLPLTRQGQLITLSMPANGTRVAPSLSALNSGRVALEIAVTSEQKRRPASLALPLEGMDMPSDARAEVVTSDGLRHSLTVQTSTAQRALLLELPQSATTDCRVEITFTANEGDPSMAAPPSGLYQ